MLVTSVSSNIYSCGEVRNAKLVAERPYLNWPRLCDKELRDTVGGSSQFCMQYFLPLLYLSVIQLKEMVAPNDICTRPN